MGQSVRPVVASLPAVGVIVEGVRSQCIYLCIR